MVIGLAGLERGADPIVEGDDAGWEALDLGIALVVLEEIAEEHGPHVGPFGLGDEFVDEEFALVGAGIGEEGIEAGGVGDATGEVEGEAAEEFGIGGAIGGEDGLLR